MKQWTSLLNKIISQRL